MVVQGSQPLQVHSLCLERFQDSGTQFLRSFSEPLVDQEDFICGPRGLSCSGALNTTFDDCAVSCSGFFGDVQKEDLRLAQDFDRLEDLTKEYNRWKAKYSKNLVFNASAPYFSECSHQPDNKLQTYQCSQVTPKNTNLYSLCKSSLTQPPSMRSAGNSLHRESVEIAHTFLIVFILQRC